MPEHIVVRCFTCRMHQVIQENKKQKFSCKLCSAKQSVKAVVAKGAPGPELRQIVQTLNMKNQEEDAARIQAALSAAAGAEAPDRSHDMLLEDGASTAGSRWTQYARAAPSGSRSSCAQMETKAEGLEAQRDVKRPRLQAPLGEAVSGATEKPPAKPRWATFLGC